MRDGYNWSPQSGEDLRCNNIDGMTAAATICMVGGVASIMAAQEAGLDQIGNRAADVASTRREYLLFDGPSNHGLIGFSVARETVAKRCDNTSSKRRPAIIAFAQRQQLGA